MAKGHHIFNIMVRRLVGQLGIGIVGRGFLLYKNDWLGRESNGSYGTWDRTCLTAGHNGKSLKQNIVNDIKIKEGDIVKVDLDLNQRTLLWEINGNIVANNVAIDFNGPAAIATTLKNIGSVEIVQYFNL